MRHAMHWIDRLRVERVVWSLDQRLSDLPRPSRIEIQRDVRRNLLVAAQTVGAGQALRNLGSSTELAREYLTAQFGTRPRHSWMAAAVFFATVPFLALPLFTATVDAFASGVASTMPGATGTSTWGGLAHLQTRVTYTFTDGEWTSTGGAFAPLFYVLWVVGAIACGRLWRLLPARRRAQASTA